jgi:LacI family repressor for deo operon, udp, cdd, tsx, nupC, and nupG
MAASRKGQAPGEAPTIYDVARECAVAPSTVSRAFSRPAGSVPSRLNGSRRRGAAGVPHDPIARALVAGRTAMVALVVSDITNTVYLPVMRGAQQEATGAGFSMLLLCDSRESAPSGGGHHWSC